MRKRLQLLHLKSENFSPLMQSHQNCIFLQRFHEDWKVHM